VQPHTSLASATVINLFANDGELTTALTDNGKTIIRYRPTPNNGQDVYTDFYHNTMALPAVS